MEDYNPPNVNAPGRAQQSQAHDDANVFDIARQIEALLQGQSNRNVRNVLNLVGSLHGIRAIPADRPIGQSTVGRVGPSGTTIVVPPKAKGKPTPPAPWKQTEAYRSLNARRSELVTAIKSFQGADANKQQLVISLRDVEREIKDLHRQSAGNH